MYYINPFFASTERVFPGEGRKEYLKLDMNENTDGLPDEFLDEFKERITTEFVSTYPEPHGFERAYAKYINVGINEIMATNGSDMAIRYAFETFGEPGKYVVTVAPSFEMYRINAQLLGLKHKAISYNDDLSINICRIIESIDYETSIVVLLNPNNPVGDVYSEEDIRRIIEKAEEVGAVVIIDEAYHYFCQTTYVKLINEYSNVMVFRTFSKLFAMAACRLGVIISNPEIIGWLRRGKLTFDVNSFALMMGEMILEQPDIIEKLIHREKEGKEYLVSVMESNGYVTKKCEGNFVFIYPKSDVKEVEAKLKERKILIKTYSNPLLKRAIRVTTASKEIMQHFVENFLEVDKGI